MTPDLILATIRTGLEAWLETMKWLQTPEGRAFSKQATTDRAAWDKFWKDIGLGLGRLFKGELWKLP